jgi:hypothetical protein
MQQDLRFARSSREPNIVDGHKNGFWDSRTAKKTIILSARGGKP